VNTAYTIVIVVLAVAFFFAGAAKVLRVPKMRELAGQVNFNVNSYVVIGILEIAAAAGLLLGFVCRPLATAAAAGLTMLMIGAIIAMALADRKPTEWIPPFVLCVLSAIAVWLSVAV
jgi:uncharacterized membrane protein YphA (DoxX/SURF4 family)